MNIRLTYAKSIDLQDDKPFDKKIRNYLFVN